jgi:hypothetical protein
MVRDRVFESIAIAHSGQNTNFFIKKSVTQSTSPKFFYRFNDNNLKWLYNIFMNDKRDVTLKIVERCLLCMMFVP